MEGKAGNDFVFAWVMHYRRNLNSILYHLTSITKDKKIQPLSDSLDIASLSQTPAEW